MRQLGLGLICGGVIMAFEALAGVTLISDPRVLSIPIHENQEIWVDLRKLNTIAYGPSPEISDNHDYTYLRKTVYEKLKQAERNLPKGLKFCLYEGYRSLDLQKMIFEKQYANIRKRHPDWTEKDIFLETTKLVSPVINPDFTPNIPPHSTGAAIDVYLIDEQGKPIDMGIHPKDWMADKDGQLSLTKSTHISNEAKKNRHIMNKVLSAVGFVNYPTEYWHWSYGDRYWAYMIRSPQAVYGNTFSPH
jgi:D-alanyl-D-alanine dipeptidase